MREDTHDPVALTFFSRQGWKENASFQEATKGMSSESHAHALSLPRRAYLMKSKGE